MIHRMPSFRGIEAFVHLVDAGGIRAASRAMNLSVSAVSHRLRVLETELGVALFKRGPRELCLTPAALEFHAELQPIIQNMIAAASRVAQSGSADTVSVSASSAIISCWINNRFHNWQKRMPHVKVDIRSTDVSGGQPGEIIIRSSFRDDCRSGELRLFGWRLTPFCRPELIEEFGLKEPADLARAPLIDVNRPIGGWRAWFAAVGLSSDAGKRVLLLDTYDLMLDTAMRGYGVMIGATALSGEYYRRGLVAPFSATCELAGGAFVNGPSDHENSIVRAFRSWLLEEVANDVRP